MKLLFSLLMVYLGYRLIRRGTPRIPADVSGLQALQSRVEDHGASVHRMVDGYQKMQEKFGELTQTMEMHQMILHNALVREGRAKAGLRRVLEINHVPETEIQRVMDAIDAEVVDDKTAGSTKS